MMIHKSSPIALYLRQVLYIYNIQSFEKLSRFTIKLSSYIDNNKPLLNVNHMKQVIYNKIYDIESNIGKLSYDQINNMLSIIDNIIDIPCKEFLRYLNCLHHNEIEKGREALHRYFDTSINQNNSLHQYAILNLAIYYLTFGQYKNAENAIEETIQMAQQNKDEICLSLALNLLWQIIEISKGIKYSQIYLENIINQQNHNKINDNHNDKRFYVTQVDNYLNLTRMKLLYQSNQYKVDHKNIWSYIEQAQDITNQYNLHAYFAKIHLLRACTWKYYGHHFLSSLYSLIHIKYYHQHSHQKDLAISLSHLSINKDHHITLKQQLYTPIYIIYKVKTLLNQNLYQQANQLATNFIKIYQNKEYNPYIIDYIYILLAMSKQLYVKAINIAIKRLDLSKQNGLYIECIELWLLIAEIYNQVKQPVKSISYILAALDYANKYHLTSYISQLYIQLASLQYILGKPSIAIKSIYNVLPNINEDNSIDLYIQAKILLAKCILKQNDVILGDKTQLEHKQKISSINSLIKAVAILENIPTNHDSNQYIELYYLLARIYHEQGNIKKRNHATKLFHQHNNL